MQQGCATTEGVTKAPNPFVNSFLNLCRVCPMPTDDKVNSEYKRNFTWHDGYQATKVDVIRNAPSVPTATETSLQGKRHYPIQHHSTHLLYDEGGDSSDSLDLSGHASLEHDSRARIPDEDLKPPSRVINDEGRKKEEKDPVMSQSYPPLVSDIPAAGVESGSGVPKTTEYRSQFVVWPRPPGESCGTTARKSASMSIIAASKKQDTVDGPDVPNGELWNGAPEEDDDDAALDAVKRGRIKKTEYKSKFRPFSAYTYVDGSWKKATRLIKDRAYDDMDIYSSFSYPFLDGELIDGEPPSEADRTAWYSEVVERLKKADQYRVRGHAGSSEIGTPDGMAAGRAVLSPVSLTSASARTWKDDRPIKERGRPCPVPVHHRKKETDTVDYPKSREGSTKRKPLVERTTVRPKSAEPVIPVKSEHKSPKRTRPRAPRDLPVHGHGDLSGRKKAYKLQQSAEKSSPSGGKPRSVSRAREDGGKVWLKPDSKEEGAPKQQEEGALVNGFGPDDHFDENSVQPGMTGDDEQTQINGEHTVLPVQKPPMKVPLTTVKSPEEVTGVRSPDPESWTVPLEIGKGLHWMDGKTPDGVHAKGPPIFLQKRLPESSLVGKSQKDNIVVCDPGNENTGESVDL